MPILVEINSGKEASKTGILPEQVDDFIRQIADLRHLRVQGLMMMGPRFGNPEDARPYFRETKAAFDRIAALSPVLTTKACRRVVKRTSTLS
jgi:uncharacterized pyridoxal phosphate-containing UPF0001 family protein